MYLIDRTATTFMDSNTTFTGNQITNGSGGAIYITGANASLTFSNGVVEFINNTASSNGGAIYNNDRSKISFENNTSVFTNNSAGNACGAVLNDNRAIITITSSTMTFNNNSSNNTGAVLNQFRAEITVTSSTVIFNSNSSNIFGGAINNGNNSRISFTESTVTFHSNRANNSGGAIFNDSNSGITFTSATVIFSSNTASSGGAIYNTGNANISFTGSAVTFSSNTAGTDGGAIYITNLASFLNFSNSIVDFIGNRASGIGGAIYITGANSSLTFSSGVATFISNTAYNVAVSVVNNGGAIYATDGSNVTFENGNLAIFNYNRASSGGAMYVDAATATFTNSIATFTENRAINGSGGALYINIATAAFINSISTFTGNQASSYGFGGAIYILGDTDRSYLSFIDSTATFTDNMAGQNGGAIYTTGSNSFVNFSNSVVTFTNNAAGSGGAIYNYQNSTISFTGSSITFSGNTASSSFGGAIYNGSSSTISFTDSSIIFSGNTADSNNGGAIYNMNASTVTFTNTNAIFSGNTAFSGGAIYNNTNSLLKISGEGAFIGNKATATNGNGGAIYNAGLLELSADSGKSISFTGNSAGWQGNDIYNTAQGTITITGVGTVTISSGISGFGLIEKSAGIFNINGNSSEYTGVFTQTGGNTIVTNNTFAGVHNLSNGSVFELATGAAMSAGAHYALDNATMTISADNDLAFGGQINGTGWINKTGAGDMHFMSGADINFDGRFDLAGGNVHFSTSAKISSMEIEAAGTLTLDVDFIGSLTSVLYFEDITINTASKLHINYIGTPPAAGAEVTIFYSNIENGEFSGNNIADGSSGNYTFEWKTSNISGYQYMGLLTYNGPLVLGPWNNFVSEYKTASGTTILLSTSITAGAIL
ncbi:MAG: hypothetical protein FWH43_02945, partial [Endomicrobia bacterium]|nr:hypothetical protein [Endomicrobiia bacterium]